MKKDGEASTTLRALVLALLTAASAHAFAAEPSRQPSPSPEGVEEAQPAVSGEALENLSRGDAAAPAQRPPQSATSSAAERAQERAPETPSASGADSRAATPRAGARADRLELDTTIVTGNRELPKVLYIVPWKKADIGDLPAQQFNTLLDEVLTPVDRDVFRREVTYYEAVSSGGDASGAASPSPAERTEK